MLKVALRGTTSNLLDKRLLKKVKVRAFRNGAWFRALHRLDRVLVDLTIRVVDRIRSATLVRNILTVIKKLEENVGGDLLRDLNDLGFSLARKLGLIAQRWGNTSAKKWAFDLSFLRFLVVLHINDPRYSKTHKSYPMEF